MLKMSALVVCCLCFFFTKAYHMNYFFTFDSFLERCNKKESIDYCLQSIVLYLYINLLNAYVVRTPFE